MNNEDGEGNEGGFNQDYDNDQYNNEGQDD
jgi:hypothetical protein